MAALQRARQELNPTLPSALVGTETAGYYIVFPVGSQQRYPEIRQVTARAPCSFPRLSGQSIRSHPAVCKCPSPGTGSRLEQGSAKEADSGERGEVLLAPWSLCICTCRYTTTIFKESYTSTFPKSEPLEKGFQAEGTISAQNSHFKSSVSPCVHTTHKPPETQITTD